MIWLAGTVVFLSVIQVTTYGLAALGVLPPVTGRFASADALLSGAWFAAGCGWWIAWRLARDIAAT